MKNAMKNTYIKHKSCPEDGSKPKTVMFKLYAATSRPSQTVRTVTGNIFVREISFVHRWWRFFSKESHHVCLFSLRKSLVIRIRYWITEMYPSYLLVDCESNNLDTLLERCHVAKRDKTCSLSFSSFEGGKDPGCPIQLGLMFVQMAVLNIPAWVDSTVTPQKGGSGWISFFLFFSFHAVRLDVGGWGTMVMEKKPLLTALWSTLNGNTDLNWTALSLWRSAVAEVRRKHFKFLHALTSSYCKRPCGQHSCLITKSSGFDDCCCQF